MSSAPPIVLRQASTDDVAALAAMYARFIDHQLEYLPDVPRRSDFHVERWVAFKLRQPSIRIWVAARDGAPIAFCETALRTVGADTETGLRGTLRRIGRRLGRVAPVGYFAPHPAGYVANYWVEPGHRGAGVAKRLVEHAVADLFAHGALYVTVDMIARNEAAIRTVTAAGATPWAATLRWQHPAR